MPFTKSEYEKVQKGQQSFEGTYGGYNVRIKYEDDEVIIKKICEGHKKGNYVRPPIVSETICRIEVSNPSTGKSLEEHFTTSISFENVEALIKNLT